VASKLDGYLQDTRAVTVKSSLKNCHCVIYFRQQQLFVNQLKGPNSDFANLSLLLQFYMFIAKLVEAGSDFARVLLSADDFFHHLKLLAKYPLYL
jgi:hypothetical protein